MAFSGPRSNQGHRLLQLAAIIIALLLLFCVQLSFGRQKGGAGPDPMPPVVDPPPNMIKRGH
ncbi:unnamed protein product [Urochloa decumbens]|uniref:Uncharacterized protein n=1 Tax=Urochloa decumbens TaxID=240449 RepID=A0ABC9H3Q7_9POAL